MNRNTKGIIAVAVFGGVAYLVYRWVKGGGITKLLEGGAKPKKVISNEDSVPYYSFDRVKGEYSITPKGFAKKGEVIGNHYGREQNVTIGSNVFRGIVVYQPDESGIVIDKTKVKIK